MKEKLIRLEKGGGVKGLSLVIAYFFFSTTIAFASNTQSALVTANFKNSDCTLKSFFKQIEEETDFRVVYSASKIPLNAKIKANDGQLDELLSETLKPLGITYSIKKNVIVVQPSQLSQQLMKEKGNLTGTVIDNKGKPLSFATVVIKEFNNLGTVTDNNGNFKMSQIPEGNYTLIVSFLGYETQNLEISIKAKQVTRVKITLSETQSQIDEAVVYGNITRGQAMALNQQKNSYSIKNVVSSEQFTRFPDRNAAEVVSRIPSVSVDYDQGEGQNVQIRGLSPQYNSLTINGQRIPAPDPDDGSRGVGLDLLNQNLLESIEVIKAITPDLDGDAIGGTINFKMKEAPDSNTFVLEAGSGYNLQHSNFEKYGKDVMSFSGFWGNRFMDKKLGILAGGSYYKTNRGSILREYNFTDDDDIYDNEIFAQHTNDYDVKRQRYGLLMNMDYKFNDFNKLYINVSSNIYLDDEIRRSVEYNIDGGEETRETRNRREDQRLNNIVFGGENKVKNIDLDYMFSWIKAVEYMPDRTYWRFARDLDFSQYTNEEVRNFGAATELPGDPLELNRLRWNDNTKKDQDVSGLVNVTVPFNVMGPKSYFKTGAKYLVKSISYNPFREDLKKFADPLTIQGGEFGQVDIRITDIDTADLDATTHSVDKGYAESSYEASEIVFAGYGMFIFNLGTKVSILTGARVEQTTNKYKSLYLSEENLNNNEVETSYPNVLPSLHFTYKPMDKMNIRLAYSTGLSRPNYISLVPLELEGDESNNIVAITKGNPDLKPTTSKNIDFMFERYTNYLGFFSAGLFYKKLSDIITSYTYMEDAGNGITWEVTTPENREEATIMGFEVAFNQRLHFIQIPIIKDLSVYGNYTYTDSEYEVDGRKLPLSSSPRNVFNLALMYDNDKTGWSFVISNVYRDALFISEGDNEYLDHYFDSEYRLDISIGKRLCKNLSLLLQLNNLTDQEEHEVIGNPQKDYSRLVQWEKYNSSGMLTLHYNF
jgi:TonB-dependent receptor